MDDDERQSIARSQSDDEHTDDYWRGYAAGINDHTGADVLHAVLEAAAGTLDTTTPIADHPNVKFVQMERVKWVAAAREVDTFLDRRSALDGTRTRMEKLAALLVAAQTRDPKGDLAKWVINLQRIPRYKVSDYDGMILPRPQPDGEWLKVHDVLEACRPHVEDQAPDASG